MICGSLRGWLRKGLAGGLISLLILMPNVLAMSGDYIQIIHYADELHDDPTPEDDYPKQPLSADGIYALNSTAVLRFDGNADGDLRDDQDDYDLYNHIVIVDQRGGDIQFAYKLTEHDTYSNGDGNIDAGDVVMIKGDKYVVTDNETSDQEIELGPAITLTLRPTASADIEVARATIISGTKRVLYGEDGILYFYDGNSLVDSFNATGKTYPYRAIYYYDTLSDEFMVYKIYVVAADANAAKVVFVEKSQLVKIINDADGIIGYSSVKIGDPDWFTGGMDGVYFLSDQITLSKGDTLDLPDTYYQLKYTTTKKFDIQRKKMSTVPSGTKLKDTIAPGKDFLASGASITVSVVSGDINIDFNSPELHDDYSAQDDYTRSTFADAGYANASVNALNSSAVLRFDANADGDLKDAHDYDLYNHIVIVDQRGGDIQFAYKLTEHDTYSNGDGNIDAGEVVKIKGDNYITTNNHTFAQTIELGPAIPKTLSATTVDKDNAVVVSGTKKILYGNDGHLYFYDGNSLVDLFKATGKTDPYKATYDDIGSDEFRMYEIYVLSADSNEAKVTLVEKSQLVKFSNDEDGVMGYSSVKIGDTAWFTGGTDGVFFLGDPISLSKGETIDLPDTYYMLKYTTTKKFDIKRKKMSSIASGTKLKTTASPGNDFLKENILLKTLSISAPSKPDLTISSYDIYLSDPNPRQGDTVVIYARARNIGASTTDNFTLTFYGNGGLIGQALAYEDQRVNVPVTWTSASGTYEIKVVVDEDNAIAESNENNNFATKSVRIGDIRIEIGFQELHDDDTAQDDYTRSTLAAAYANASVNALNSSAVLRFDGNADGDLKDQHYPYDDYDLYNHIVIIDQLGGDIQFAYNLSEHETYSNGDGNIDAGEVVTIKGDRYVITTYDLVADEIELGPAVTRTLRPTPVANIEAARAIIISGTKKVLYDEDGILYFYDGNSLVDSFVATATWRAYPYMAVDDIDIISDEFKAYRIYVLDNPTNTGGNLRLIMVEKSQLTKLTNNEEGAMGYGSVKIGDSEWFTGGTTGVFFLSDPISLSKGMTVDLPDTYYMLKYTTTKKFDILRKKTFTVASGTELKTYTEPGRDFLKEAVILSLSAGEDISFEFHSQELHDGTGVDHPYAVLTDTYDSENVFPLGNSNLTLRFDGNADNDLRDTDDYTLYNAIVIIDQTGGDIQFAYNLSAAEHSTYSNNDGNINAGEVVTIKGGRYVVTTYDISAGEIELGPAITATLRPTPVADRESARARVISGTKRVLYGEDGLLYFYDGTSLLDSFVATGRTYPYMAADDIDITSDEFKAYKIYVLEDPGATGNAKIAMVEESQLVKIANNEEGVMGYRLVKIGDSWWYDNGVGVFFLSDPMSLAKGETIYLPDTYYALKYTSAKKFDILRRKTSSVASGTKLKTTASPGKDFLKENIIVTAIGSSPFGCGDTLSIDTVLTEDLSNCIGYGLEIVASDIVLDCAGHSITGATGATGIYISGRNNTVRNCVLKSFDRGIEIYNSDNNTIINNIMTDSWGITGIHIESSNYNTIVNNFVSSKSVYGIVQYTSNYNIISNNTVTDIGDKGIYITGTPLLGGGASGPCSHSNISGNNVSDNGYGIYLDNEDNNLVTENYVYANTIYGIYLNNSWLNSVYHNNFVNNSNHAYDDGTSNTWDNGYPGGGNYWSDYAESSDGCDDTNTDGFCDSPYNIGGGSNQDRYPFIQLDVGVLPKVITTLSDGSKEKTLNFDGPISRTIYLKINPIFRVTSASFKLQGLYAENLTRSFNTFGASSGGYGKKWSGTEIIANKDMDLVKVEFDACQEEGWGELLILDGMRNETLGNGTIFINNDCGAGGSWNGSWDTGELNGHIPLINGTKYFIAVSHNTSSYGVEIGDDGNPSTNSYFSDDLISWSIGNYDMDYQIYEGIWSLDPSLDVGNDSDFEWNYTGEFNFISEITDLSNEINGYIMNYPKNDKSDILVPLVINSNSAGKIRIFDIEIRLDYNTVCPAYCKFASIQAAVDAAKEGDTIYVLAGTYNENVNVYKSLNLIGDGADVTIVNASNSSDHVFEIGADWVNLSGFTITNSNHSDVSGIYIQNKGHINLSNNVILHNGRLDDHSSGIYSMNSSDVQIINNNVSGFDDGIYLNKFNLGLIYSNTIENNGFGLTMIDSSNNSIQNNSFKENVDDTAIQLSNSNSNNITKNYFINDEIRLHGSSNYIFENDFIGKGNFPAIELQTNFNNNLVYHNNFINVSKPEDYGTNNTWDNGYPGGGNYWSDWTSPDSYLGEYQNESGSDGIVDVAYSISGGSNQDRYPVTTQDGWLYITPDIVPPTNPAVTFSLSSYMRKVGSSTTIPITMNTTTGIGSIQLDLIYDPSVINATNVAQGSAAFGASFAYAIDNSAGKITIGIISDSGMSSNGSIADITFNVTAKGGNFTDLTLVNHGVTDPKNNELAVGLYNGNLTVYYRLKGDADADGMITAADALLYLRYAVGQDISPYYLGLDDDVICDDVITAADALQVLRKAVGQDIELEECPDI